MRLLDDIDKFLCWWAEGLALIVPKHWRERQQRLKQYLLLAVNDNQILIEHHEDGSDGPTNRRAVSTTDGVDQSRMREWIIKSRHLSTLPVILRLPSERILVKRLRYPNSVGDDLSSVIAFDIDRQTPFSSDDVYFGFEDITSAKGAEHIDVDLLLVPKREVEPLESIVRDIGLRLTAIDVEGRTFEAGVNLLPAQPTEKNEQSPYRLQFALFLLWMMLIAFIPGKQILDAEATIAQLEKQERTGVAAARPLNTLRAEHARLIDKLSFFGQLQSDHVAALDVLYEVTRLLSDTTWIRRFDLKDGSLTLQGESSNASEIPGILEGSSRFSSPKFSSPVTRNNATGNDRFQIAVSIDAGVR